MNDIILDWFCLINSKGIGPKTFWHLLKTHKTADLALKYIKDSFPRDEAKKILNSSKVNVILANHSQFPHQLRASTSCPPMLFYRGDLSILKKKIIGIIGSRNASLHGISIAYNLAKNLSQHYAIISGLAKGIDTSAHKGSLENNNQKSAVAVLPFCIDEIYPQENTKLHENIGKNGLLLSEIPPHKKIDQGMFHARNRIIAGLSCCIIIIEAALKSGTMQTAGLALDLGCDVFAVPGSPIDPRSSGSNFLIKNGAPLIENYIDVLNLLEYEPEKIKQLSFDTEKIPTAKTEDKYEVILEMLSDIPISIDQISNYTKIDINDLLCIITELELLGKIIKYPTNYVVLI